MRKIIRNKEKYMPKTLFKYRNIENGENLEGNNHVDALINENIYLSNPIEFNDPYDSAFSISIEKLKENMLYLTKKNIVKEEFDKKGVGHLDLDDVGGIEQVYNDITIHNSELIDDLIVDNSNILFKEFVKRNKFNICCFSEIKDSILMWSHYANEHQGFCIGYNLSSFKKLKKELFPVFYHETLFPQLKLFDGKFNSLIKYKDWQYENEWRLFSNECHLSLKPSEIYLGVKFEETNIDFFKDIALEKNCKLYKMKMNYSKYALECEEIVL